MRAEACEDGVRGFVCDGYRTKNVCASSFFFLFFPRVALFPWKARVFSFPPSSLCLPTPPITGKFYFVADAVRAETGHACATSSVRAQRSAGAAPQEWALRIWDWQNLDCIQRHKGAGDEEEGGEPFSC